MVRLVDRYRHGFLLAATMFCVLMNVSCAARPKRVVPRSVDLLTIQGTLSAFADAAARQDLAAVGRVFAEDAIVVRPGHASVRGHAAILEHYRRIFDERDVFVYLHVEHVSLRGDESYCRGTMEEHAIVQASHRDRVHPAPSRARFHILLRRASIGGWRIAKLMQAPEGSDAAPEARPSTPENRPA